MADSDRPGVLVVAPAPGSAISWAAAAALLVVLALIVAVPSDGGALEWIGVGVAIAVAAYFVVPVVAPAMATLVLDAYGVRGRLYHVMVDVPWEGVEVARVVRVAGEPVLELHVRRPSPQGDGWRTHATGYLLPIGTDVAAVEAFLASRGVRRR